MHIYRHWQKRKHLAASYDEWWIESGGRLADDDMFDLSAAFVPRDISSLKVNKRQLYRRRYQMLAEIAGQIERSFAEPKILRRPLENPRVWIGQVKQTETAPPRSSNMPKNRTAN
jgi:hypothetical protein